MQTLIPETEEGNSMSVIVEAGAEDVWIDLIPTLLRTHLLPKVPDDGKLYTVRFTWTIGGM